MRADGVGVEGVEGGGGLGAGPTWKWEQEPTECPLCERERRAAKKWPRLPRAPEKQAFLFILGSATTMHPKDDRGRDKDGEISLIVK